jgi:hypothetical protein
MEKSIEKLLGKYRKKYIHASPPFLNAIVNNWEKDGEMYHTLNEEEEEKIHFVYFKGSFEEKSGVFSKFYLQQMLI